MCGTRCELVDAILTERTMFPRYLADLVRRRVGGTERLFERVGLFSSRKELHLYGQLHKRIIRRVVKYREVVKRRVFLRALEGAVSNPAFL